EAHPEEAMLYISKKCGGKNQGVQSLRPKATPVALYSKLHHVDYAPRLPLQDPPRYSAEWRVPHIAYPLRFAKIAGQKYVSNPACPFQSPLPNPQICDQKKPLKSQSSYP